MSGADRGPEDEPLPSYQLATWTVIGLAIAAVLGLSTVRLEQQPETTRDYPPRPQIEDTLAVMRIPPEIDDEYMPCSDCHAADDPQSGTSPRELEDEHEEMEFEHGNLWCLHCHDPENRDVLHLADASVVEFEDSWRLCTQCHGKKLPEWRAGVHGKQTGHWRGEKEYLTCVACHDPHSPAFGKLLAKPRPKRPDEIVYRENHQSEGVKKNEHL